MSFPPFNNSTLQQFNNKGAESPNETDVHTCGRPSRPSWNYCPYLRPSLPTIMELLSLPADDTPNHHGTTVPTCGQRLRPFLECYQHV